MTSSHQGQKIAEAFWRRLWLKEVHLSSGLFVFIRVHLWFVFNNDQPFVLAGSARQGGARLSGKREFPKGDRPAFREVARRIPPTSPSGRHPRERGRPARMLSLGLPLSFPAMLQPSALPAGTAWARPKQRQGAAAGRFRWRRWPRLCQAWCGRDARAPRWASSHDLITPRAQNCGSTLVPLVVEGGPSVFWSIRVHSCPFVVRLH